MSEARLLGDRYELGEVIGRGGMAEVRRGRDTRLGRIVALKMLRVDHSTDGTFQARFSREAQSAASLNHRNIVAVYDTGEDYIDGHRIPYIVMEYVEGQTLREILHDQARFTPERAIEVMSGTLDALEYSHRAGIVHRDIKPGNIMITTAGEVKVMDFGIARSLADTGMALTQTAAVVGTAQYISPEQARGEQADARSDLYATGCVLYELLTGRPPFVGDSLVSVAISHVREQATPPSALDPSIPRDLDAIVLKALAKDRLERYQSAYEMRADLQRAAAGLPVAAAAETASATQIIAPAMMGGNGYDEPHPLDDTAYDDVDDEDEERTFPWAAVIFATILALLAAGFLGYTIFRPDAVQQVVVPDVVGATQEQAVAQLDAEGLTNAIETQETQEEDEVGTVLAQDPPGNTRLEEGGLVTLTVGVEPGDVQVPANLVGMSVQDARAAIAEAGLTVGTETFVESDRDENEVLSADPAPGSAVAPGTPINLEVSTGEETVEMPDLRGRNQTAAENELDRLGLEYDIVEQPTGDANPGTVLEQTPDPGTPLAVGDTVTLTVAVEAEEPDPLPTDTGGEWGDENGTEPPPSDQPTDEATEPPPGNDENPGNGDNPGGDQTDG